VWTYEIGMSSGTTLDGPKIRPEAVRRRYDSHHSKRGTTAELARLKSGQESQGGTTGQHSHGP